jgi:peptidyl-prolyl cis-trans isomerase C
MSNRYALQLAIPLMLAVSAPAMAQDQDVAVDTVIATVNSTEITLGHMLVIRARLPQQYNELDEKVLFDGILDQIVQQTILSQQSDELTATNRLILQNEERALLSSQVVADAARAATTDEAVQEAYDAEFADAGGETEFNASHILVETEEEAQAVVADLEGGADFGELAREKSTGPSGPNGGVLGWFGTGMMVPAFEQAVVGLAPGQISPPVQTQFGWHVIILNEKRQTEAPTLEEVRDQVVETIQRSAIEALVAELKETAEVQLPEEGAFDPALINQVGLLGE